MTTNTSRGVPIAEDTDPANIADRVNAVANVVHERPGVSALTTTQRNALAGVELWDGRVITNTTNDKIERYDAATTSWRAIADAADFVVQTQAQAESDTDNIGRLTTGQRIYQAIAKWAVTLAGSQTITGYKNFTTFPHVNSVRVVVDSDTRLDPLSQAEAESNTSTTPRVATGQRLYQAIAKWAVTLSGSQTVTGYKNFTGGLRADNSPVVIDSDARLDPLTQAQAESSTDTTPRLTTGQRIYQAIAKWAVTLAGSQTVTGSKNFTGGLSSAGSPVLAAADLSGSTPPNVDTAGRAGTSSSVSRADHTHAEPPLTTAAVSYAANVASSNEGSIAQKRGSMVTIYCYVSTSATVSTILTVPAAYRPTRPTRGIFARAEGLYERVLLGTNGVLTVEGGIGSGELLYGSLTYVN